MITQKQLKEQLHYVPSTGLFYWKQSRGRTAKKWSIAGSYDDKGYIKIKIYGTTYKAHRLVFMYVIGRFPEYDTDHINQIKNDNRWCNLREVTNQENQKNRPLQKNNKSGVPGVSWHNTHNRWDAYITVNKVLKRLGRFIKKEDAIKVRKKAEKKYGFHENHGK